MFKMPAKFRKLIAANKITCGYVYQNGVALREEKQVKISKYQTTTVNVMHIFPCEISFSVYDYDGEDRYTQTKVNRIVCHNPHYLAYGVKHVNIYLNNASESLREIGAGLTDVTVITPDEIRLTARTINNKTCGQLTVQPNPYENYSSPGDTDVLNFAKSYADNPIIHDD